MRPLTQTSPLPHVRLTNIHDHDLIMPPQPPLHLCQDAPQDLGVRQVGVQLRPQRDRVRVRFGVRMLVLLGGEGSASLPGLPGVGLEFFDDVVQQEGSARVRDDEV